MNRSSVVVIFALVLFLTCGSDAHAGESPRKWVGRIAPRFSAIDLEGREVVLSHLLARSKAVVVNFWGVRCQSCIEEIPYLVGLAAKFGSRGVQVVGVNADGISGEKIKEALPKIGLHPSYPMVSDPEFKVMDAYEITVTPYTLVVRPDGKVAYEHMGFTPGDEQMLESELRNLLDSTGR